MKGGVTVRMSVRLGLEGLTWGYGLWIRKRVGLDLGIIDEGTSDVGTISTVLLLSLVNAFPFLLEGVLPCGAFPQVIHIVITSTAT